MSTRLFQSSRRTTAQWAFRMTSALPGVHASALAVAARRGRALVLIYHRVSDRRAHVGAVVTPSALTAQLGTLRAMANVVPLAELTTERPRSSRVRVAITFDDDAVTHVESALPVLERLGMPATFFLSGRSLHQCPPYWWETLDAAIDAHGLATVGRTLGVRGTAAELARAGEDDPEVRARLRQYEPIAAARPLTAEGIRALAAAGMTIGFHTLRHPVLPSLDDQALDLAMVEGRRSLEDAAGVAVTLIAYPYGRADRRVAGAAERAGFTAGFVTGGRAMTPRSDRFLLPRWEPGPLSPSQLLAQAIVRLHTS